MCFAYTGRAEITSAIRSAVSEMADEQATGESGGDRSQAIGLESIEKKLYTSDDPPLDIVIRTSGAERLSDFLLWQCNQDTQIYFLKCLWPQIGVLHLIMVFMEWQWRRK